MRILPVLDLMNGIAVRAVAGRRKEYRPLTPADPLAIARGFRARLGHADLYVADLDAIAGAAPEWDVIATLHADGFSLWLDAGVRSPADADALAAAGVARLIVGLETVAGPAALAGIVERWGERVVFSLDLRDGVPITARPWASTDARSIADEAITLGVKRLLLLDLARVGVGQGTGTEGLLADLHRDYPEVEFLAGGGVRNAEDLHRLTTAGASWVLVASALHDGTLPLRKRPADDDLPG
jgi:phosphoribosylformimino-5-aminoimidazole carboxamide ribotide isomerase